MSALHGGHTSRCSLAWHGLLSEATLHGHRPPITSCSRRAAERRMPYGVAPQVIHCNVSGFKGFENSVSCSKDECHFFLSSKYHRA